MLRPWTDAGIEEARIHTQMDSLIKRGVGVTVPRIVSLQGREGVEYKQGHRWVP
jgi:hypothetical protein